MADLIGFRVSGYPPPAPFFNAKREGDDFALHQVAIEHAHRLHRMGWRGLKLDMVLREEGAERLQPMTLNLVNA